MAPFLPLCRITSGYGLHISKTCVSRNAYKLTQHLVQIKKKREKKCFSYDVFYTEAKIMTEISVGLLREKEKCSF